MQRDRRAGKADQFRRFDGREPFAHRVFAAFLAMAIRSDLVSASARAAPPLAPPSFPSATAAGFLPASLSGSGDPSRRSPMACSTTRRATVVKSCSVPERFGFDFFLLERLGMAHSDTNRNGHNSQRIQTDPLPDTGNPVVGWLIVASSALFVTMLALAAYWDPTIRVLHAFEAVPYVLAAVLALRRSKLGYALGVAGGAFWLWLAGWLVTFVRNGFEQFAVLLRTGRIPRPDVLIAAPAAVGAAGLVVFSVVGYLRVRDKSWRDLGAFGVAFVVVTAFFVAIFAAFDPRFLAPLEHLIKR
jgi:hypothetical protein